ncbi:MAG: glycosyltransferase family 39 protein, partial [Anaerolineales bacterium]|nr:glycosyltransferase family 39 protein [Anaerolineales bacterium]
VQWFSMVGSLIGTSLIARQFGATQREQIIASVITATIPMGIIQASSTQNDYMTAFWMVCFIYFGLAYKKDTSTQYAFFTGSALGLAILTKATAYIFAFPFVVWIGISVLRKFRIKSFKSLAIIVILTMALNTPHYIRNCDLYGNPLGPGREAPVGFDYANNIFTAPALVSNIVRNIGVHLGTPYSTVNEFVESQIYKFHEIIGISANDPRTTWTDTEFHILPITISDTYGSAFLHVFLIFFSMIVYLKQKKSGDQPWYMLALIGGFVLFCTYLKWQPWLGSRLHLSFFVLWSPCIGVIICRIKNQNIMRAVLLILLITAAPWIVSHNLRPLFGQHSILKIDRTTQILRDSIRKPYTEAITFIEKKQQCHEIGLISGFEIGEYPLWSLLEKYDKPFRLEHVNVTNASSVKSELPMFSSFTPCVILTVEKNLPVEIVVGRTAYVRTKIFDQVSVYAGK